MKSEQGNSRAYTLNRLKREARELFERVVDGDLSANAAAISIPARRRSLLWRSKRISRRRRRSVRRTVRPHRERRRKRLWQTRHKRRTSPANKPPARPEPAARASRWRRRLRRSRLISRRSRPSRAGHSRSSRPPEARARGGPLPAQAASIDSMSIDPRPADPTHGGARLATRVERRASRRDGRRRHPCGAMSDASRCPFDCLPRRSTLMRSGAAVERTPAAVHPCAPGVLNRARALAVTYNATMAPCKSRRDEKRKTDTDGRV
jgi:hypothetical protein